MTTKKKYIRVKDRRVGLAVTKRKLSNKRPNQWTRSPKHYRFAEYYFMPNSETYSNAYKSALKAGFSPSYARRITSHTESLEWLSEARRRLVNMTPLHTVKKFESIAINSSKEENQLRALENLAKIQGLFIDRSIQQIDVQFTNGVPRPSQKPSDGVLEGETVPGTSQGK